MATDRQFANPSFEKVQAENGVFYIKNSKDAQDILKVVFFNTEKNYEKLYVAPMFELLSGLPVRKVSPKFDFSEFSIGISASSSAGTFNDTDASKPTIGFSTGGRQFKESMALKNKVHLFHYDFDTWSDIYIDAPAAFFSQNAEKWNGAMTDRMVWRENSYYAGVNAELGVIGADISVPVNTKQITIPVEQHFRFRIGMGISLWKADNSGPIADGMNDLTVVAVTGKKGNKANILVERNDFKAFISTGTAALSIPAGSFIRVKTSPNAKFTDTIFSIMQNLLPGDSLRGSAGRDIFERDKTRELFKAHVEDAAAAILSEDILQTVIDTNSASVDQETTRIFINKFVLSKFVNSVTAGKREYLSTVYNLGYTSVTFGELTFTPDPKMDKTKAIFLDTNDVYRLTMDHFDLHYHENAGSIWHPGKDGFSQSLDAFWNEDLAFLNPQMSTIINNIKSPDATT